MSDYEYMESLIARYKVLQQVGDDGLTTDEAVELLSISMMLREFGFTLTEDESDWLPPFTPDEA
jgi:hypothetical protein